MYFSDKEVAKDNQMMRQLADIRKRKATYCPSRYKLPYSNHKYTYLAQRPASPKTSFISVFATDFLGAGLSFVVAHYIKNSKDDLPSVVRGKTIMISLDRYLYMPDVGYQPGLHYVGPIRFAKSVHEGNCSFHFSHSRLSLYVCDDLHENDELIAKPFRQTFDITPSDLLLEQQDEGDENEQ